MEYKIEKILDSSNNITGYRTIGLRKKLGSELIINLHLNEYIVRSVFDKVCLLKDIPEIINGITNMPIKLYKKNSDFILMFPDTKGIYPNEPGCEKEFLNQI